MKTRANTKLSTLALVALTLTLLTPAKAWGWKSPQDLSGDCTNAARKAMQSVSELIENPNPNQISTMADNVKSDLETTCQQIGGSNFKTNQGDCGKAYGQVARAIGKVKSALGRRTNTKDSLTQVNQSLQDVLNKCNPSLLKN